MPVPRPVDADDEQIASLRGAAARPVDPRRLRNVAAGICATVLLALAVTFFVTGAQHNATVSDLERHGVRVVVTVTACTGQLGGSGSNAAGYSCQGAFTLGGRRYVETIPGNAKHNQGSTLRAVAVPGDPKLVSPVTTVRSEHATWHVFILPGVLYAVALASVALMVVRSRRRVRTRAPQDGGTA